MSAPVASMSSSAPKPKATSKPQHDYSEPDCVRQGRYPTRAYGILMDWECICRWGAMTYQRVYGEDTTKMTRRDRDKAILRVHGSTIHMLPLRVYLAIPTLPRLWRSTILMDEVKRTWLFVLKDNSSHEAMNIQLDKEDVKAVKAFLGLEHERAQWHHVSVLWSVP